MATNKIRTSKLVKTLLVLSLFAASAVVGFGVRAHPRAQAKAATVVAAAAPASRLDRYRQIDDAPDAQQLELTRQLLAGSGGDPAGASVQRVQRVLDAVKSLKELGGGVSFDRPRCYRDGCLAVAHYASLPAVGALDGALPGSPGFIEWPGAKHRTAPAASGKNGFTAGWVFFSADE